jgi:uncharacterized membrane protein
MILQNHNNVNNYQASRLPCHENHVTSSRTFLHFWFWQVILIRIILIIELGTALVVIICNFHYNKNWYHSAIIYWHTLPVWSIYRIRNQFLHLIGQLNYPPIRPEKLMNPVSDSGKWITLYMRIAYWPKDDHLRCKSQNRWRTCQCRIGHFSTFASLDGLVVADQIQNY